MVSQDRLNSNVHFVRGRIHVGRNPDAKHNNIDRGDEKGRCPFQLRRSGSPLSDDCNTVDDNLKKKLNFEDIREKNEEQRLRTSRISNV